MSSMASACDHVAHVKTQLPYAVTVGLVSIVFGFVPAGLGLNPFISLGLGLVALYAVIRIFGKKTNVEEVSIDESNVKTA
jgi:Na+/H+ antiporter NhaC